MKILCIFFIFSFGLIFAVPSELLDYKHMEARVGCHCLSPQQSCNLGMSGFSTTNRADWYTLLVPVYPSFVPLSINGNRGSTQGRIKATPTGLTINKAGNYHIDITVVMSNQNQTYAPIITVFLVENGVFDPTSTRVVGSALSLPPNQIFNFTSSGILENVKAGTTFSLVSSNGGSPEIEPITISAWGITAYKIPCSAR